MLKQVKKFNEMMVVFYGAQVVMVVGYLHENGVLHGDIKLKNMLAADDGYVRLTGFERSLKLNPGKMTSEKSSRVSETSPPELLNK